MCGIWALFGNSCPDKRVSYFEKIKHRGPDAWRMEYDASLKNCHLGFHRLSIIDSLYGMQPMKIHKYPRTVLICNGELYNYKRLQKEFDFPYETKCDIECIIHLYMNFGIEKTVKSLDGVFAFCLIDMNKKKVFLGRDPYGVRPLFRVYNENLKILAVSSEAKGIVDLGKEFKIEQSLSQFHPGYYEEYSLYNDGSCAFMESKPYFVVGGGFSFTPAIPLNETQHVLECVNKLFTEACRKRLMSDRRIGCMLSGGLDSSLVAALIVKLAREAKIPYKIQTFSIGMEGSPDLIAAKKVADHIGSEHHEVVFTEKDVGHYLDDVIYHLESYDITTVRASLGMYMLSKYIHENTDSTVIFSGEGADELAQGYIYFRDAPDKSAAHNESIRLLKHIYLYDGLRADRTTSAFSLELRVPFLDIQFTDYYLKQPKELRQPKNGLEKHLLRSAFDGQDLIPYSILWRHKEAFSDGVASKKRSLFTIIGEIVNERVSDDEYNRESGKYTHCPPKTKEAYYYRKIFEKSFCGYQHLTPYYWMPKWIEVDDPSARFIKHYAATD